MNVVQRVAKNSFSLILARLVNAGLSLLFVAVAARALGASGFGAYSFVLVYVGFGLILAEFGLLNLIVKDVARDPARAPAYLVNSVALKLGLIALSVAAGAAVSPLLKASRQMPLVVFIGLLSLFPSSVYGSFNGVFRALERMDLSAALDVVSNALRVAAGVCALWLGGGLLSIFVIFFLSESSRVLLAALLLRRMGCPLRARVDPALVKHLFVEGCPFMLWNLVGIVYYKVDVLMLSQMKTDAEVGYYTSAYRLIEMLSFFGLYVAQSLVPVMSRFWIAGKEKLGVLCRASMKYVLSAYMLAGLVVAVYADRIVGFLFGPAFFPSVLLARIMAWAAVIMVVNFIFGSLLIATDRYRKAVLLSVIAASVNVVLNLVLIPPLGGRGAAVATLVSEVLTVCLTLIIVSDILGPVVFVRLAWPPLAALALAAAVMIGVRPHSLVGSAAGGAVLYGAVLLLLGFVTPGDLAHLKRLFLSEGES